MIVLWLMVANKTQGCPGSAGARGGPAGGGARRAGEVWWDRDRSLGELGQARPQGFKLPTQLEEQ